MQKRIDITKFKELASKGLTAKEIACQLNCSKYYVFQLRKKYSLRIQDIGRVRKCHICGEIEPSKFYKTQGHLCKKCHKDKMTSRIQNFKQKMLKIFGVSSCQICGYSKCYQALEFHHLDPKEKEYNISQIIRHITSIDNSTIENELKKCILVCSNCHREIHAGITKIK